MFGTVQNVQTCPDCHGTGKIIRDKCPDCHGTGYVSNRKTIEVTVPAGIDNGQSIRIRGKGEPGTNGGPRGDLLVEVIVERHPKFQRQDTTIYSTEPISLHRQHLVVRSRFLQSMDHTNTRSNQEHRQTPESA